MHRETKYPKIDSYLGSGKTLLKAIKKYGKQNFNREIITICTSAESAFELETQIVNEDFINKDCNYNIRVGGCGTREVDLATKYKISRTQKKSGLTVSVETRRKMSKAQSIAHQTRPPHTEETKAKIGNSTRNPADSTRKLLADANQGIKLYNNGTVNKRCFPGKEPQGFKLGTLSSLNK